MQKHCHLLGEGDVLPLKVYERRQRSHTGANVFVDLFVGNLNQSTNQMIAVFSVNRRVRPSAESENVGC